MKIYTSYFAKLNKLPSDVVPIAICGWPPKWYNGLVEKSVAPTWDILNRYKTDSSYGEDGYTKDYVSKILSRLDANSFVEKLKKLSGGKDVVLLCFEKPSDFCHRHIVAKWITEKTGITVSEILV